MQMWNRKKEASKSLKNRFGESFGLHLGGFGTVWGLSWALLGASWLFFGRSKSGFVKGFVQDGLQEAFWIDFGSLWEGFGRVLGGFVR